MHCPGVTNKIRPASQIDPRTQRLAQTIGERIREARTAQDLSQEAVALLVGMSRTNYARIEYGKTNLTSDSLRRIADALGLEANVLLVECRLKRR